MLLIIKYASSEDMKCRHNYSAGKGSKLHDVIFGLYVATILCCELFNHLLVLIFDPPLPYCAELSSVTSHSPSNLLTRALWGKIHSISEFPGVSQLPCINALDTCHEDWSPLIRIIRFIVTNVMWYGPDIEVSVASTPLPRETRNTLNICSIQAFNLARKKRQTNCYDWSLFLGNCDGQQLLHRAPSLRRKSQSTALDIAHLMGANTSCASLPRASSSFTNYHPIKCLPNFNQTEHGLIKPCYVVLPFYLQSYYKSN